MKITGYGSDSKYADKTLPDGLGIKTSSIPDSGQGVLAETAISNNVRFGPYGGVIVKDKEEAQDAGYAWMVSLFLKY